MNKIKKDEYFKWKKTINTHRKQQEKQIMISLIMLCFSEPFKRTLKAEKIKRNIVGFLIHIQIEII